MSELTILGGGPAGLGVAYYATRAGMPIALYERASEVGGLCRTFRLGAHRYDAGAHRFHDQDAEVTADVRDLLGDDLRPVDAPSQIYDRGRFVDFPPTPLGMLFSSGLLGTGRIGVEILRAWTDRREPQTFRDAAVGQFGESLAHRYLLTYSEKVWGLPADQLSPDVATRRLSGMTIGSLVREVLLPHRKTEHIDGTFLYPRTGYGMIAERLRDALPPGAVNTGCEIGRIECRDGRVVRLHLADGRVIVPRGPVVSTLPLTALVGLLGDALPDVARQEAGRLRFRHVRLLFLRLGRRRVTANASIYVPDPGVCLSRVSEPKNRSDAMAPAGETSLVVEVPCFTGDAVAQLDDAALADRVQHELDGLGLVRRAEVLAWRHHFLPHAYPVYALDYASIVGRVTSALEAIANLDTLGRGGRFLYGHLHHQLRAAKDYVAAIGRA